MATNNNKRGLSIELHDFVRELTITGQGNDNQVVICEELNNELTN